MKTRKIVIVVMCVLLVVGLTTVCFGASKFPERQITIVVGFQPGGASDMVSRIVAKEVEKQLKVPVIVVNKTGAAGAISLEYVKSSKKDGYTIAYTPVECTMYKALGYASLSTADFDFLGRAMTIPAAVTVRKKAPWNTINDFFKYAKNNPGKIKIGNSGMGSIWQIAAASMEDKVGCKFLHVPFEGAAPAVAALMGDHIDAVTVSPSEVLPGVKAGELKVLAVMGEAKSGIMPNVPLLKDTGVNIVVQGWGGFAVPKGTPARVKRTLEEAFRVAIASDDFQKFCKERGFDHAYLSGDKTGKFAKGQYNYYQRLIKKLGIMKK
jgi:tripartite-type tricarboxylate transporter receptor subunit TctC